MPRSTPDKATARRTPITTELLVDAAIELIESDGLDMLSMRRLADRFGIQAASVYWYVASKEHMLDLVVDRLHAMAVQAVLVEQVEQRRTETESVQQVLRRFAIGYRSFLLAHPDSARVISSRLVVGENLSLLIEELLTLFRQAGLAPRESVHAAYVLLVYVQGFVLHETAPLSVVTARPNDERSTTLNQMQQVLAALPSDRFPNTSAAAADLARPDMPTRFTFGLDLLLAGLTQFMESPAAHSPIST
ncbi:MAG TPA: TetR/AcrR family transcriptional regulator C-terminal domain-containing protein [Jatrophihabitans sp.]|nr:TetR/AcrR family transcriptional regulator C-terminal domain-containing protein [Jatrophihabitans sp.]